MSKINVTVYYANWCGYCTPFKTDKTWKHFVDKANQYGGAVSLKKIEQQNITRSDINSFPTIKIEIDGKEYDYEHARTPDALFAFIDNLKSGAGIQKGGSNRTDYQRKYLKYKTKYLKLKLA